MGAHHRARKSVQKETGMGVGSILSPPPSDLYIAIPWMWRWAGWAVGDCGVRAVRRGNVVGGYQESRCQCDSDACEREKRPANEHNKQRAFQVGNGGTAMSTSATGEYTSRCRWMQAL